MQYFGLRTGSKIGPRWRHRGGLQPAPREARMLNSKLHRPWKPRMSGSLPLTSFSHGPDSEADSTFSEDLDTEREAISEPIAQEVAEFMSSVESSAPKAAA